MKRILLLALLPIQALAAGVPLSVVDANCSGWTFANNVATCTSAPTPPIPPIPPTPGTLCAGYAHVLPTVVATWAKQGSWLSPASGAFGDNTVWVFQLTVPAGTPNSTEAGAWTVAEYNGINTPRQLTISKSACDFRPRDYTGANGPLAMCQDGTTCQFSYSVSTPQPFGGLAGLTAGTTYYINARNWSNYPPPPAYDCGMATCNAIMNTNPATP